MILKVFLRPPTLNGTIRIQQVGHEVPLEDGKISHLTYKVIMTLL